MEERGAPLLNATPLLFESGVRHLAGGGREVGLEAKAIGLPAGGVGAGDALGQALLPNGRVLRGAVGHRMRRWGAAGGER